MHYNTPLPGNHNIPSNHTSTTILPNTLYILLGTPSYTKPHTSTHHPQTHNPTAYTTRNVSNTRGLQSCDVLAIYDCLSVIHGPSWTKRI